MRLLRSIALLLLLLAKIAPLHSQVLTPMEVPDPRSQRLQQQYIRPLMDMGGQIEAHKFPYPFYFSRVLDVDLEKEKQIDQRSIRLYSSYGQTGLEITHNSYASYSRDR